MQLLLSVVFVTALCFSSAYADTPADTASLGLTTTPARAASDDVGHEGDLSASASSKPLAEIMSGLKDLIVPRPGKPGTGKLSSKANYNAGPAPKIGVAKLRQRTGRASASSSAVAATASSNVRSMAYLSASEQAQPTPDVVEALVRLTTEGSPAAPIQVEASTAALQEQPAFNVTSSSSGMDIPVTPSSVCAADPPFQMAGTDGYSRTTCRLFVHAIGGEQYLCTAWFISSTHAVTAGHCVAQIGAYIVNPSNPGKLCCAFNSQGQCLTRYSYRLTHWITTEGYWKGERSDNDGAVIRVVPENPGNSAGPVPQELTTMYPNRFPAGTQQVYLDGYPARTSKDLGCQTVIPTRRYYTQADVLPLGTAAGTQGTRLMFALSGCVGESGGRVLLGGSEGAAFGIQTFGSVECRGGRGMTGVTQIIDTAAAANGVCISCLQDALP